mmetsp:Transcript_102757/g.125604  ORF Transcript_102757/g.125604 Transcript_102757/m.125604 type:complete len:184 (+) Transcript_102757:24-575(+)
MPAYTIKVAVIGNQKVGKSKFCNAFAGIFGSNDYDATVGVRIIDIDTNIIGKSKNGKQKEKFEITLELWDVSGDLKYKDGWKAIQKNCLGIMIMFNPKIMKSTDVNMWIQQFMTKKMNIKQCLLILTENINPQISDGITMFKQLNKIILKYNNESINNDIKDKIIDWIGTIFGYHSDAEFGVL